MRGLEKILLYFAKFKENGMRWGVNVMDFGKNLREYRESLGISQTEAALRLDLVPNTYSNYERGERQIPIEYLPLIKEKFEISDEQFLDMLLDRPRQKLPAEVSALKTKDIKERYLTHFGENIYELIEQSPELRQLLSFIAKQDKKSRRLFLNAIRTILSIYGEQLKKETNSD